MISVLFQIALLFLEGQSHVWIPEPEFPDDKIVNKELKDPRPSKQNERELFWDLNL